VAGFEWLRTHGVSFTNIVKEANGANTTLENFADQRHLNLKKIESNRILSPLLYLDAY
jgi:hypothetical protein